LEHNSLFLLANAVISALLLAFVMVRYAKRRAKKPAGVA
jgi:hypothetical protein